MKLKFEKVYKVTFMSYTDLTHSSVSDWDGVSDFISSDINYLDLTREPFLLRESELDSYSKYGQGFRDVVFVGNMPCK